MLFPYYFITTFFKHFAILELIIKIIFGREQWKGYAAPYHPIFMDGWSPEYPIPVSDDHLINVPTTGPIESKKSRDEIKNSNPEVNI